MSEYRKAYGSRAMHNSQSGGTQPLDEYILKLFMSHNLQIGFPSSAKMVAGNAVQRATDLLIGWEKGRMVEPKPFDEAVRLVKHEYSFYKPRQFDEMKDAEDHAEIKQHIEAMTRHSLLGLNEYFNIKGNTRIQGEQQGWLDVDGIDVKTIHYIDFKTDKKMVDLKTSYPKRNPIKKDGTFTFRIPKPLSVPTRNQVIQQAVYWKATGLSPAVLSVTPEGFNIITPETSDLLKKDSLEYYFNFIRQRWLVRQNLLKNANGSWNTLFQLVEPDLDRIKAYHGNDIHKIAELQWGIK